MTTIWDAITEGEDIKRKRQTEDLKNWEMQQRLAMDQQHTAGVNRLNDEEALQIQDSRGRAQSKQQADAYNHVQSVLRSGDVQGADYLSKLYFGKPLQETTKLPQAPQAVEAPPEQPPPMYGPQPTPEDRARAMSLDISSGNVNPREKWMELHPDAAGTPDPGQMEQDLRRSAAQQQADQDAQAAAEAAQRQQQQGAYDKYQVDTKAYNAQMQAARERPTYAAGDVQFDPMAGDVQDKADIQKLAEENPSIAEQLMAMSALKRAGFEKAAGGYLAEEGKNNRADVRGDTTLEAVRLRNQGMLDAQGLRNEGSLAVAKARHGKGSVTGGEPGTIGQKESLKAYNALQTEERGFKSGSNYSKLLFQKQKADEAEAALKSGNPLGTAMAMESTIAAGRGGVATSAFLKMFQQHASSYGGKMENFIAGIMSGDLGDEAKANLQGVIQEQKQGILQEANALKQGWSSGAFANDPEKYKVKGNYEDSSDRLWTPFGFEPIKRDPSGGRVGVLGGRAPSKAEQPKSVWEAMTGAKKDKGGGIKKAESMIDDYLSGAK